MPYSTITQLPDDVRSKYTERQQRAFMAAFNDTYDDCEGDDCEGRAMRAGHSAAHNIKTIGDALALQEAGLLAKLGALFGVQTERKAIFGFKMLDTQPKRWLIWYSNAFGPDREGEFVSTKALERDIDRMVTTGNYPELWFDHIPGTRHGQADAAALIGRIAVATGTFDDTPIAQKFQEFYAKTKCSASFGFLVGHKAGKIVNSLYTFEVSAVWPTQFASNQYTNFEHEVIMNEQQAAALKAALDNPELLKEVVESTEAFSNQLEKIKAFKADMAQNDTEDNADAQEVDAQEAKTEDTDTAAVVSPADQPVTQSDLRDALSAFAGEMQTAFATTLEAKMSELRSENDKRYMKTVATDPQAENGSATDFIRQILQDSLEQTKAPEQGMKMSLKDLAPDKVSQLMLMGREAFESRFGVKIDG